MKASDIDRILGVKARSVLLDDLLTRAKCGKRAWRDLPACPGIYAVCLRDWDTRSFAADAGHARYAKPVDPNRLRDKRRRILAAGPTDILYIGKAGGKTNDLRERVKQLARFGVGKADNHQGGEWLWQVQGISDANVLMWCCPRGTPEPRERELLEQFRKDHGDWPLANRQG